MKFNLHVHYRRRWDGAPWEFVVYSFKASDSSDCVSVCSQEVELDVPADFDPTAKQVEALKTERAALVAEFTAKLRGVDEQLANLQAITHEVPA